MNIYQSPGHLLKVQQEQWSPEDQNRAVGADKLNTAYQRKNQSLKINLRLKSVHIDMMSEEKDDLKGIKVYKFNNTTENWHEFPLEFRSLQIAEATMELLMEL